MRTIWRFDFDVDDAVSLNVPKGARFLPSVKARSASALSVWAEVESGNEPESRLLLVVGTGNPFDPTGHRYVGTALASPFVWHVYEAKTS